MPMVTYKLDSPIYSKNFNFNKFVNSLDLDDFLLNPNAEFPNFKRTQYFQKSDPKGTYFCAKKGPKQKGTTFFQKRDLR